MTITTIDVTTKTKTEREFELAKQRAEESKIEFESAQKSLEDGNFDELINETSRILGRFESAKADVENFKDAERKLQEIRNEYKALSKAFEYEDFDGNINYN